jgi:hypothetical protein
MRFLNALRTFFAGAGETVRSFFLMIRDIFKGTKQ